MKTSTRILCLAFGFSFFCACQVSDDAHQVPDIAKGYDSTLNWVKLYEADSITRRSVADSIRLWIVPNHMLWIPLEFDDPHYKPSTIEIR